MAELKRRGHRVVLASSSIAKHTEHFVDLLQVRDRLQQVGGRVFGVVVNMVPRRAAGSYYYYYYEEGPGGGRSGNRKA